jgi:hypothetical protein
MSVILMVYLMGFSLDFLLDKHLVAVKGIHSTGSMAQYLAEM